MTIHAFLRMFYCGQAQSLGVIRSNVRGPGKSLQKRRKVYFSNTLPLYVIFPIVKGVHISCHHSVITNIYIRRTISQALYIYTNSTNILLTNLCVTYEQNKAHGSEVICPRTQLGNGRTMI